LGGFDLCGVPLCRLRGPAAQRLRSSYAFHRYEVMMADVTQASVPTVAAKNRVKRLMAAEGLDMEVFVVRDLTAHAKSSGGGFPTLSFPMSVISNPKPPSWIG